MRRPFFDEEIAPDGGSPPLGGRREFLARAALSPLLLLGFAGTAAAQAPACFDPAALPLSQRSRRRSAAYTDPSPDPARSCALCSYFSGDKPGCGSCTILNGPVGATALCDYFGAKGAK